jgi:hypothetical protein
MLLTYKLLAKPIRCLQFKIQIKICNWYLTTILKFYSIYAMGTENYRNCEQYIIMHIDLTATELIARTTLTHSILRDELNRCNIIFNLCLSVHYR